ncbi:hypothetical protein ACSBR2_005017 [Camellia fascicularis]
MSILARHTQTHINERDHSKPLTHSEFALHLIGATSLSPQPPPPPPPPPSEEKREKNAESCSSIIAYRSPEKLDRPRSSKQCSGVLT